MNTATADCNGIKKLINFDYVIIATGPDNSPRVPQGYYNSRKYDDLVQIKKDLTENPTSKVLIRGSHE